MKALNPIPYIILVFLFHVAICHAALNIKVGEPKSYGHTTIINMDLHNTFTNTIDSVRAVVFLLNDAGKIVGEETRWILGGTKERPPLKPDQKTSFHFVVQSTKPFAKSKVTITRIVLEGGQLADSNKDVQIEFAAR